MNKRIIVLGAGLSGLLTAHRLKKKGFSVQVLEARSRVGGRIYTTHSALSTPVEMGATWFGEKHIHLMQLLKELGIAYFEQHTAGTAFFEPFSLAPPQKIDVPGQIPSYRISGGSATVIDALAAHLTEDELLLGQEIKSLNFEASRVVIRSQDDQWEADAVISTLPPALLFLSVDMMPALATEVKSVALATHTWMQDTIKTALVYKEAFWRDTDLSGTIFSNVGPVTEFYDHSDHKVEKFALCGFVNGGYAALTPEERKKKVLQQLEKFFGKIVHDYLDYVECVWNDPYTKHPDMADIFPHNNNGHPIFENALYDNRFFISGSETARDYPGYMDGAVQSAGRVVEDINRLFPSA